MSRYTANRLLTEGKITQEQYDRIMYILEAEVDSQGLNLIRSNVMIIKQALKLRVGQYIYDLTANDADGSRSRWKVNGKVRVWKRLKVNGQPKFDVPIKRGLYQYGYLHNLNIQYFTLEA